jgi:hypothetical protein
MAKIHLSVAREFTDTPGPRSREEGEHSGQEFLETLLKPKFQQAISQGTKLLVDLDGTEGYATSFLEAAFGGLAREFGPEKVLEHIEFKCDDEPYLEDEIKRYIREANQQ